MSGHLLRVGFDICPKQLIDARLIATAFLPIPLQIIAINAYRELHLRGSRFLNSDKGKPALGGPVRTDLPGADILGRLLRGVVMRET